LPRVSSGYLPANPGETREISRDYTEIRTKYERDMKEIFLGDKSGLDWILSLNFIATED